MYKASVSIPDRGNGQNKKYAHPVKEIIKIDLDSLTQYIQDYIKWLKSHTPNSGERRHIINILRSYLEYYPTIQNLKEIKKLYRQ